ncbi:MAG: DUF3472 domain-containing protein [Calditrichaeota bacterium]|nr:DUF3472 domain-containing protein [Calditrichota bacterium]
MSYRILFLLLFTVLLSQNSIAIPIGGNSWVVKNNKYIESNIVGPEHSQNWTDESLVLRSFVYFKKSEQLKLGLRIQNGSKSGLKIRIGKQIKTVDVEFNDNEIMVGDFQIDRPGYTQIDIELSDNNKMNPVRISHLLLENIQADAINYIKDDFYFGRRGPSVHLRFEPATGTGPVEWFYSELFIPRGEDVIGSYFMANGFAEGYFGIQVNSETERRILFSVWSPYKTDKPSEVPEDYKIRLIKKGKNVHSGEFGDEGSGGQSYKVYNWKANTQYGFLTGAKPDGNGNTDYICYFFDPEVNEWQLIAQFKRPKTNTYLTHLYSFLENFIPFQGVFARKGYYQNQWVYANGKWQEINSAKFTADNTARKGYRLDYSGGVEGKRFYLKNCGFTSDTVEMNSVFERQETTEAPRIDFSSLD